LLHRNTQRWSEALHSIAALKAAIEPMATIPPPKTLPSRKTRWAWLLCTFFGAGYLAPGPGTYGSVAAVLLWYAAAHAFAPSPTTLAIATALAAILTTAIGIPASTIVAREAAREDPGFVVIDEVAGQLFALILMRPTWQQALLALLLFRLFDITKPGPIRRLEALPNGTGIMLDDVAAGLLAVLTGALLTHFAPHLL
jgi:phosphatidylglycerophosphatase A